jgi:hypothetical protein
MHAHLFVMFALLAPDFQIKMMPISVRIACHTWMDAEWMIARNTGGFAMRL